MTTAKLIPEGFHTVTPYLTVKNASEAIEFYKRAFAAVELFRLTEPSGKIGHAEIRIGDSHLMISDEYPDFGALGPRSVGGTPVKIHLYVEDVDTFASRAVAAGATVLRPIKDEFYGDRCGLLADPFGHCWFVATHKEDVSPEEMQKRWAAVFA